MLVDGDSSMCDELMGLRQRWQAFLATITAVGFLDFLGFLGFLGFLCCRCRWNLVSGLILGSDGGPTTLQVVESRDVDGLSSNTGLYMSSMSSTFVAFDGSNEHVGGLGKGSAAAWAAAKIASASAASASFRALALRSLCRRLTTCCMWRAAHCWADCCAFLAMHRARQRR